MPKGKSYDLAIDYWKIAVVLRKIRHLLHGGEGRERGVQGGGDLNIGSIPMADSC